MTNEIAIAVTFPSPPVRWGWGILQKTTIHSPQLPTRSTLHSRVGLISSQILRLDLVDSFCGKEDQLSVFVLSQKYVAAQLYFMRVSFPPLCLHQLPDTDSACSERARVCACWWGTVAAGFIEKRRQRDRVQIILKPPQCRQGARPNLRVSGSLSGLVVFIYFLSSCV